MTTTSEPTALEAEAQCLNEIRRARLAAGDATAVRARATADAKQAERDRQDAAEANARGEEADEQFAEASERLRLAEAAQERAQIDDDAAGRVIRSAEARLAQVRQLRFDELAAAAEDDAVAELTTAAEALAEPLTDYLATYAKALATWRRLGPAAQARVLEMDRERGRYRDVAQVMEDASLPECPLPPNAVALVRGVVPRPRFMRPGYESRPESDGVEITDATPT